MAIAEIIVRRFFTSEEAEITPSVSLLIEMKDGEAPYPDETIAKLLDHLGGQLKNFPATDLREMTREEVDAYRASEE